MACSLSRGLRRAALVAAGCVVVVATTALGTNPAGGVPRLQLGAVLAGDPTIAAAGDIIGNCTGSHCGYRFTANVVLSLNPTKVLGLGDISNRSGAAADYTRRFAATWGRFKAKISPVPGNHDYLTAGAKPYYSYFRAAAHGPMGYYSFDVGSWHIVAINSNCGEVGGCQRGSKQERWLRADLVRHPATCTLAFWHHPRYSSLNGDNTGVKDLFQDLYTARADVVLSGHSHMYERFAPQNTVSQLDSVNGITQFVVGTGGSSHAGTRRIRPNSRVRNHTTFGVLRMTLGSGFYSFRFVPIAGKTFTDSGKVTCHRAKAKATRR